MGESSPSLLSSMWFLLALPALVAGQCQVNLDKVNGKYPPLLLQNSQFIFPTEKVGKKEFSTLRRLTLLTFSVMVAAMRSKLASLCGGQTKARRTARYRSLVKVESSLCLVRRRRLLWRRRLAIRSRNRGLIASRSSALLLATMAGPTSWKVFRESPSGGRLRAPSLSRLASALMRATSERFGQTTLCEEPALLSGILIPRGQVSELTRVPTLGRTRGFSSGLPAQS